MSLGIRGLGLARQVLDLDEEAQLLAAIDGAPWSDELRRRVQHYGWRYQYKGRGVGEALGALPPWAAAWAERLLRQGTFARVPDQVIVNEYLPGQGIAAHVDSPVFGNVIASLSLGADVIMNLRSAVRGDARSVDVDLPRRSLLVLAGPARRDFTHGIAARQSDVQAGVRVPRGRRVSITFRTLAHLDAAAPPDAAFPSIAHHARLFARRLALLDGSLRKGLLRLRQMPLPPGVDLVQLELFEDRQLDEFPIEVLCKSTADSGGEDHYSAGQSHQPYREARAFVELVTEPLGDASLEPYMMPDDDFNDVLSACDLHRYEQLSAWLIRAWDEVIGAAFPVPAYFVRLGDDAEGGAVWDLRRRVATPWESMYEAS